MNFNNLIYDGILKGRSIDKIFIPIGLSRIDKILKLRQAMYYLIGGNAGTGKSAFVDQAFVLEPFIWWYNNQHQTDKDVFFIVRSMERKTELRVTKWLAYFLWRFQGLRVSTEQLLGWEDGYQVTDDLLRVIEQYRPVFDCLLSKCMITAGVENPTGVYNQIQQFAEVNGTFDYDLDEETQTQYFKNYTPNNPNLYVVVLLDHIGKVSLERGFTKKQAVDKMSEYLGLVRDRYNYIPVVVSQLNRAIADSGRMKMFKGSLSPQLEDFKDTGATAEDCDMAISLFNPYRYKIMDSEGMYKGYDLEAFIDSNNHNRFRTFNIIKNTYGLDDAEFALDFRGDCGHFTTLPQPSQLIELQRYIETNLKK